MLVGESVPSFVRSFLPSFLPCQVYIFRHLTEETDGDFHVCQDAPDLIETLRRYITPLEVLADGQGDDGGERTAAFVQVRGASIKASPQSA